MENEVYSYTFLVPVTEHLYHTYQQETRLSSTFHDSIMTTHARVRHKTTNLKLSCTIMTPESGADVQDRLMREYTGMRSTGTEP